MTNSPHTTNVPSQKTHTRFSVQALLVILLAAVAIEVLVLWRLGLSFQNGQAVAATLTSIMLLATFAEFVRRRFRISLKAWFGLFTILAVGIKSLGELPHLEEVVLRGRQVTDQTLAHLRHLKRLRWLSLWGTNVSDAGLIHLKELQKMESISLTRNPVTQQGVDQLKAAMPKVVITAW